MVPGPAPRPGPTITASGRFFYYPYYYFPHSYWPTQGPQWPERPGTPYMRPPAYMAYPAFQEPDWRYELWEPQELLPRLPLLAGPVLNRDQPALPILAKRGYDRATLPIVPPGGRSCRF